RFPQFDWIAFRIMDPAEPADLRIPLRAGFDCNACRSEIRHDHVEILDPEVDQPLLFWSSEIVGAFGKRREHCWPRLLAPHGTGDIVYAEMPLVPRRERLRIVGPEEKAAYSSHLSHLPALLAKSVTDGTSITSDQGWYAFGVASR